MLAAPQEPMPSTPATVPVTTTPISNTIAPSMYSQPRVHPSAGDIVAAGSSRVSNTHHPTPVTHIEHSHHPVAVQQARHAPVTTTAARVPASLPVTTSSSLAYQNMHMQQPSHDPVPTTTYGLMQPPETTSPSLWDMSLNSTLRIPDLSAPPSPQDQITVRLSPDNSPRTYTDLKCHDFSNVVASGHNKL